LHIAGHRVLLGRPWWGEVEDVGVAMRALRFPRFAKLTPCHVLASVEQHAMRVAF
jgi:hypothetical protein